MNKSRNQRTPITQKIAGQTPTVLQLFAVVMVLSITSSYAQTFKSIVKGRVIDKNGAPVERALVTLESAPRIGGDEPPSYDPTVYTDANGSFVLANESSREFRTRSLFVTGPIPEDTISLIDFPPTERYGQAKPGFLVTSVALRQNNPADVGDVQINVETGTAHVAVLARNRGCLFSNGTSWQRRYYVLRNEAGLVFVASGISINMFRRSVDIRSCEIRFAVPEGKWRIEFVSDLGNLDSVVARTKMFTVTAGRKVMVNATPTR